MSKMGRPKSDVVKDHIVTIRMSDEEHIKLRDYSEKTIFFRSVQMPKAAFPRGLRFP
mgnify:CR=1 FL=1